MQAEDDLAKTPSPIQKSNVCLPHIMLDRWDSSALGISSYQCIPYHLLDTGAFFPHRQSDSDELQWAQQSTTPTPATPNSISRRPNTLSAYDTTSPRNLYRCGAGMDRDNPKHNATLIRRVRPDVRSELACFPQTDTLFVISRK